MLAPHRTAARGRARVQLRRRERRAAFHGWALDRDVHRSAEQWGDVWDDAERTPAESLRHGRQRFEHERGIGSGRERRESLVAYIADRRAAADAQRRLAAKLRRSREPEVARDSWDHIAAALAGPDLSTFAAALREPFHWTPEQLDAAARSEEGEARAFERALAHLDALAEVSTAHAPEPRLGDADAQLTRLAFDAPDPPPDPERSPFALAVPEPATLAVESLALAPGAPQRVPSA